MNAPVGSGRRVLNCAPPAATAADALGAAIAPTAATPATRRALSPALRERREREKKCFTLMRLLFGLPPANWVAISVRMGDATESHAPGATKIGPCPRLRRRHPRAQCI